MFYSKHGTQLFNDPNNTNNNFTPNDNKPLLLVGLSIATIVITIITIVLVLVSTGNNKRKTIITHPKTSTEFTKTVEITTAEETTEITEPYELYVDTSLSDNYYNISQTINGNEIAFDGYTLTVPKSWSVSGTVIKDYMFETYMGVSVSSLDDKSPSEYLKELCLKYNDDSSFEFGNLTTNNKGGYYMKSEFQGGCSFNIFFINATDNTVYEISILSMGEYPVNLKTAQAIAASIEFN